jgi:drug/metabolite transporter (DMT)-like permease
MFARVVALLTGVFACSTSVIFIKASHAHPILLSGYRLALAAVLLLPSYARSVRRHHSVYGWPHVARTLVPALVLAAHFISWTVGARATTAANASIIVNMVPIAMPFFLFFSVGEVINRGEIAGTLLSICGVALLAFGDYAASRENLAGDVICFFSMLLFAWYLALGRRNRDFPGLWLYLVPLYGFAGLTCFAAALPVTQVFRTYEVREYLLLIALAVVPTIVGHSLLNYSMKHLRGQIVSIATLGQFVFAGVMAFALFGEIPERNFYVASALILAGSVLAIRSAPREAMPSTPEAVRTGKSAER